MDLELLPLLDAQRRLLDTARGFARFHAYLATMLDARGEVALPLAAFNPMSKPHVAERLDALLAMDAEEILRATLADAAGRLHGLPGRWRVGLVVVDDAQGGWTDRFLTDADHQFAALGEVKRGFITVFSWTGEETAPEALRTETLSAIYRTCHKARHGAPTNLRAMLTLVGLTGVFVDVPCADELSALTPVRAILDAHLETTSLPTQFACLYGDDAAVSVGYPPLGVPPLGGFAVAVAEARRHGWDPLTALSGPGPTFGRS